MKLAIVVLTLTTSIGVASEPLTVLALVEDALRNNPELKFYEAELQTARAELKTATAWSNPEVSATAGAKTIGPAEGSAWSVSVMQPVEWPGRIGLRKAIANRHVELAQLGLERFRTAIRSRVTTAAYALMVAKEKQNAAREVADRFQSLREVIVQRDPAGITPQLEMRVIEASELVMRRKATDAAAAYQSALLDANQLRGQPPHAAMELITTEILFQPAPELAVLQGAAKTNSFELRAREVELAQQGFRVDLAKNERFPTVSFGPTYSEERAGENERIIGLGVSLPLPIWNRNTASVEAAKAKQVQAQTSLLLAAREVERKVADAASRYQVKARAISEWRPDALQQFREAAALADRHYRLGAVPVSTYVELQREYLEAMDALLETRHEALQAAQELELLTGLKPLISLEAKP